MSRDDDILWAADDITDLQAQIARQAGTILKLELVNDTLSRGARYEREALSRLLRGMARRSYLLRLALRTTGELADEALDQRDKARDLAATYEAEIALMASVSTLSEHGLDDYRDALDQRDALSRMLRGMARRAAFERAMKATWAGNYDRMADRRLQAVAERDSARDLAAKYEAQIAMMTPVVEAARDHLHASRALVMGELSTRAFARQRKTTQGLWDAIEAHEDKIANQND